MGSGDLEMRWEYLERGEQPTPISVVKFPSKMMLNAFVGWGEKSELVWCNQHGSMTGEDSWKKK